MKLSSFKLSQERCNRSTPSRSASSLVASTHVDLPRLGLTVSLGSDTLVWRDLLVILAHLNNTFLLDRTSYVGSEDAIRLLELSCHLELSLSDLLVM